MAPPKADDDGRQLVARNRKAWHDYQIEDTWEAGLVLTGPEVKSLRAGKVQLQGGFVSIDNGEAWLREIHIAPYEQGNLANGDPMRTRKLLLHRRELDRLVGKAQQSGYTLVPLSIYFKRGKAKLEIGLGKGKRSFDKREAIRERDTRREKDRALAERQRG
jgi:SsrA-binding protein